APRKRTTSDRRVASSGARRARVAKRWRKQGFLSAGRGVGVHPANRPLAHDPRGQPFRASGSLAGPDALSLGPPRKRRKTSKTPSSPRTPSQAPGRAREAPPPLGGLGELGVSSSDACGVHHAPKRPLTRRNPWL